MSPNEHRIYKASESAVEMRLFDKQEKEIGQRLDRRQTRYWQNEQIYHTDKTGKITLGKSVRIYDFAAHAEDLTNGIAPESPGISGSSVDHPIDQRGIDHQTGRRGQ